MSLTGTYYDGATSRAAQVELFISADRQVRIHGSSVDQRFHNDDLKISDRIGAIPRALELPGGGRCDVSDNAALDSFLDQLGYSGNSTSWIHVLESRWRHVALAIVITGANALALPSGKIVVTDELVELATNDTGVITVLAHEIGHLVHRHSVRLVMQNSAVALLVTTITGGCFLDLVTRRGATSCAVAFQLFTGIRDRGEPRRPGLSR